MPQKKHMHIVNSKDLLVQSMVVFTVKNCNHLKEMCWYYTKVPRKEKKNTLDESIEGLSSVLRQRAHILN